MCKTYYVLSEDPKADRLHLTKTTDLNQCSEKINMNVGMAGYTDKCAECETVSTVFSYSFLIVSVEEFKLFDY